MRKNYIMAATIWLTALASAGAIGYMIYGLGHNFRNITESFIDLIPLFAVTLTFVVSMVLALKIMTRHGNSAKTIVQIWFSILLIVSLTAFVSFFGLLIAPAAYFLYLGMARNGSAKPA
ncbi:hypothetical protein DGWBC_0267 [Dehalogenimonas sp. WBC-2]|nr:hypothetical protein DGWBC_0267 [Dehalogenimonas sp. WBC-2]